MIRSLIVVMILAVPYVASAECAWVLWTQEESFWSYKVLNLVPGPTRGNVRIMREFQSEAECSTSRLDLNQVQSASWKSPEAKEDIQKFGGPRMVSHFACVPLPLKPTYIDAKGWK